MFLFPADAQFRLLRLSTSRKTWRQTLSIMVCHSNACNKTCFWFYQKLAFHSIISSQRLWFKRGIGEAGEGCPVGVREGYQGMCDVPFFSKWYPIQIWHPWSFPASVAGRASTISMDSCWSGTTLDPFFFRKNLDPFGVCHTRRMLRSPVRRQRKVWRRSRVLEA